MTNIIDTIILDSMKKMIPLTHCYANVAYCSYMEGIHKAKVSQEILWMHIEFLDQTIDPFWRGEVREDLNICPGGFLLIRTCRSK